MICPSCKKEFSRRRGGACPGCFTPVELVNGEWIDVSSRSPALCLLEHFEQLVSEGLTAQAGNKVNVVWKIPRRGMAYKAELAAAKRCLAQADNNLNLAIEAMSIMFERGFTWKYNTLITISRDFSLALAIARARQDKRKEIQQYQFEALEEVLRRHSIWED